MFFAVVILLYQGRKILETQSVSGSGSEYQIQIILFYFLIKFKHLDPWPISFHKRFRVTCFRYVICTENVHRHLCPHIILWRSLIASCCPHTNCKWGRICCWVTAATEATRNVCWFTVNSHTVCTDVVLYEELLHISATIMVHVGFELELFNNCLMVHIARVSMSWRNKIRDFRELSSLKIQMGLNPCWSLSH